VTDHFVYPVFSVIIVLNNGNLTQFILEDMTEACTGNATKEPILNFGYNVTAQNNYSYCPVPFCNITTNSDGLCDAKIFVSWMGTDNSGTSLISSSQRFMNFKNYNLAGMWQSILGVSSKANSTDNLIYDPTQITDNTTRTRVLNPPQVNLTVFGVNYTTNATSNTTGNSTVNSTSNATNSTSNSTNTSANSTSTKSS